MHGLAEPRRADVGGPHAHRHSHPSGSGPQGPSNSYALAQNHGRRRANHVGSHTSPSRMGGAGPHVIVDRNPRNLGGNCPRSWRPPGGFVVSWAGATMAGAPAQETTALGQRLGEVV